MKTKTMGDKHSPSNSTPRSSSPPIPHQDEANDHFDDEDDNVVVPDSVEEEHKFARASCLFRDCLGREFSYRCEGRTSQVLVCSQNDCPIAMHEVCMIVEPTFDDTGKFYCPYCWYKREVERTNQLRREALMARRDLSNFKQLKRDGGNENKHEDGADNMKAANPSTVEGKNDSGDSENELNHEQTICVEPVGEEKYDDGSISTDHGFDNVADGQLMQEEDIENTSGSGDDDVKPWNPNHFEIVNNTLCLSTKGNSNIACVLEDNRQKRGKELSTKGNSNIAGVLEDNREKRGKKEPVMPNVVGTSMGLITKDATFKVPIIESFQFVSPDLDTVTLAVRKKRIKHTAKRARSWRDDSLKNHSFQPSTSQKERKIDQQREATTTKNYVQCQELTKQIMNPTLGYGKRRRLNWTTEEEDMLKEGVRRFSLTMNKNIPWRKILEFGHNVFGNNRVSADLKDKWKKIMAKEDPKCDKGILLRWEE